MVDIAQRSQQIATKRIQKALQENCRHLGLQGLHLNELPPEIGELTSLESLDIQSNQLTRLPDELSNLKALHTINLNNNSFVIFPAVLFSLISLKSLQLNDNSLVFLPSDLQSLHNLESLDIGHNRLASLPKEITVLSKLKVLCAESNLIEELPVGIGSLTCLQLLNVSGNKLRKIDADVCALTNLESLNVNNNELVELPDELTSLVNLRVLECSRNRISQLPASLGQLRLLERLRVSQNGISEIPVTVGSLENLEVLDVGYNRLTALPSEVGELKNLQSLAAWSNSIKELPKEIGKLSNLEFLHLGGNQLKTLQPEIKTLSKLRALSLYYNRLEALPPEVGALTSLKTLKLWGNSLVDLPNEIGHLSNLDELDISRNNLQEIPAVISSLSSLEVLNVQHNKLATLSSLNIAKLKRLKNLCVGGNPLPPEMLMLSGGRSGKGTKLIRFLRSTSRTGSTLKRGSTLRRFDEAKVLILGPGEVGKTWLLRALQGLVPDETSATKGIEIIRQPLEVPHPEDSLRILHLNCWDFGGQDNFQITHQIFFSSKAIYLLIWKPRPGNDPSLTERLERIRLSAGRTAKVLIVSTHAEENVPAVIGKESLKEQFGDLIWDFYDVDSKNGPDGKGIAYLRAEIGRAVAQLEGLDIEYPVSWHAAREEILKSDEKTVDFDRFSQVCRNQGMDSGFESAFAEILEVQGKVVFFADAANEDDTGFKGKNLVVLDPEWLAKAIAFVIEDKDTILQSGRLQHNILRSIWERDEERDCPGYDRALHGYLLWLMWKFDIAYRQDEYTSLIPQLIARSRPDDDMYWLPSTPPPSNTRQSSLICKIPTAPPIGLIPALTAAVHPLRRVRNPYVDDSLDKNWRDGFFLDTAIRGKAFVELKDRDLLIVVRDDYPANLINQIRSTLNQIVARRWPKLKIDERVPCIGQIGGEKCKGSHKHSFLIKQKGKFVECQDCESESLSADQMIEGLNITEANILEKIQNLQDGQQALIAPVHALFQAVSPESSERARAPNVFTIFPEDSRWYEVLTSQSVRVTCWCEHPDGPHPAVPIGSGEAPDYLLTMPREWLVKCSPYIKWSSVFLKVFVPLFGSGISESLEDKHVDEAVTRMKDMARLLPSGDLELEAREDIDTSSMYSPEIVSLTHLHDFLLDHVSPKNRWGDLRPVQTKSGQVLWLCEKHAAIQQPPVQNLN